MNKFLFTVGFLALLVGQLVAESVDAAEEMENKDVLHNIVKRRAGHHHYPYPYPHSYYYKKPLYGYGYDKPYFNLPYCYKNNKYYYAYYPGYGNRKFRYYPYGYCYFKH